jgi:hypothetical protein
MIHFPARSHLDRFDCRRETGFAGSVGTMSHWKVLPKETWVEGFGDGWEIVDTEVIPERTLPNVPRTVALVTRQEDAHLIAIAKDGYELALLVSKYFGNDPIDELLECDIRLRNTARKLIAKARGER